MLVKSILSTCVYIEVTTIVHLSLTDSGFSLFRTYDTTNGRSFLVSPTSEITTIYDHLYLPKFGVRFSYTGFVY